MKPINTMASIIIENVPEDVMDIICTQQNMRKKEVRTRQYSLGRTICHIIREFDRCTGNEQRIIDARIERAKRRKA